MTTHLTHQPLLARRFSTSKKNGAQLTKHLRMPEYTISVTEWEYKKALSYGKSIQVYFKKTSNHPNQPPLDQHGHIVPEGETQAAHLKRFRDTLERSHSPRYFDSTEELAELVKGSLIQVYREGVRHHLRDVQTLKEKLAAMEKVVSELKATSTYFTGSQTTPRGLTMARPSTSLEISPFRLPIDGLRPVAPPPPSSKKP
ncbi:hypothetical protein [uncultured Thiodictyon sp.]|uniref:hypothetical protein n=1 Tax=uncultured Thiodictyon sp. TaxID=1846217 RepID=UPI0025D40D8B|nr:hypothetical protein [uncultured Thiodictyon sp.]